jgi:exonuclease VII large subunit
MSDTPETDAAWSCFKGYMEPLQDVKDLSRKLERERDEAIEKHRSSVIYWQRDVFKMQRERDEALAEIQRLRFDAQREAEQHDRMVKELEGLYDQLAKTKSSNEHICSLSKDLMGNCIICDG